MLGLDTKGCRLRRMSHPISRDPRSSGFHERRTSLGVSLRCLPQNKFCDWYWYGELFPVVIDAAGQDLRNMLGCEKCEPGQSEESGQAQFCYEPFYENFTHVLSP